MKILLPTLHVRPSPQATPLAAACLKAALPAELRATTRLLDIYPEQPLEQALEQILGMAPDVVALPLYLWNRSTLLELARCLRKARPNLFLIGGGPEASADAQAVLTAGRLDAVIRGEGEESFAALLSLLAANQQIPQLPGLYTGTGELPVPACCASLESLPSPYLEGVLVPEPGGGLLWEVARGCPFACSFCYDAKGAQGVRPLPEKRLEEELKLFAARGVSQVWVLDSTFNHPAARGRALLELLLRTAPGIHYHLEAKAEALDDETIRLLTHLSCSVQVGLQSADPAVLKPLRRNFDASQLFRRLQKLSDAGVVFGVDLIYGLPGDSHAGFRRSLDKALQNSPNQVDLFPLAVLPGTELYQQRHSLGLKSMPEPPYEIIASPDYPPEQLLQSRRLAAAVDLFYNRGRTVGILMPVCRALDTPPAPLMERFGLWLQQHLGLPEGEIPAVEEWRPATILPLQQAFISSELTRTGRQQLSPLVDDLLRYHFHYAETLLGPETPPAQGPGGDLRRAWQKPWRRAATLQLVEFHYSLEDLLHSEGMPLEEMCRQLRPAPCCALFLRRGDEVICEELQENFARLLQNSQGTAAPADILADCGIDEGLELLAFALGEGLLRR